MTLSKYSLGLGDRFMQEGEAQLKTLIKAEEAGVLITPVWNKSAREHDLINSLPVHTRMEADEAVSSLDWKHDYFVDADHIDRERVGRFISHCDFFTLDVARFMGSDSSEDELADFILDCRSLGGLRKLPGQEEPLLLTPEIIDRAARIYFPAVQEAARLYRTIEKEKGRGNFITEVSLDEADRAQTPAELLLILFALSREGVPLQTVAPRFSGRFCKGVDYEGDRELFSREFEADLAVLALGVEEFGLPENLKLSIHSGSDKFSLYEPMRRALEKYDAGLHLKTSGTTWLEEAAVMAEQSAEGWDIIRNLYIESLSRFEELTGPYAEVLSIDRTKLPAPKDMNYWFGDDFAQALRHDRDNPKYNRDLRQLMHVSYKLAAERGRNFYSLLDRLRYFREKSVMENLFERHIKPLFL
ncbi:MAG: tagaturonate epimerase family protein [Spirochaetales bacterium]|nr:tagaturonate epimerase family protein [Spirochaetales bacterium]